MCINPRDIGRQVPLGLREFILRRIINSIILVFGAITFNFIVFRLMPGNPAYILVGAMLQQGRHELAEALIHLWGLDQPLIIQYFQYIVNMFTFNFGLSFTEGFRPVIESIAARLPNTLLLMGTAAILTIVIGVVTGISAAAKRGTAYDMAMVTTALAFYSVPSFWLGMMLILIFGFYIPIFPMYGTVSSPAPEDPLLSRRSPPPSTTHHNPCSHLLRRIHASNEKQPNRRPHGGLHCDGEGQGGG